MRILIIGGTGLISTAITRRLLERGDRVTLYNRGQREVRFAGEVERIQGDRCDDRAFTAQMAQAGPFDAVIDMVCYAPGEAENVVRALRGRTGQYVFCSTVDVYRKPAGRNPVQEGEPRGPRNHYGRGKARCEEILMAAHEGGDLAVTIIRPAHTYGEGGGIIHSLGWGTYFLDRVRRGRPVIVHGDGSSLWVSCHIDDVAQAFVAALGNPRAFGRAYHVTGEEWQTWDRYHRGVAEALGAPEPRLVHIPTDLLARVTADAGACADNFCFNNIFDNSAARADLGFRYTVPWVEGVRRTVAWLDAHGRIEDSDRYPQYDRIVAAWERLSAGMVEALAQA